MLNKKLLEALDVPEDQVPNYIRHHASELAKAVKPPKHAVGGFAAVIAAAFLGADVIGEQIGEPEGASQRFLRHKFGHPNGACSHYPNCVCGIDAPAETDKSKWN